MQRLYHYIENYVETYFRIDSKYFIKSGFWLSLTQFIVLASGIISTAIFAHFLPESQYGIYRYLVGLAAIFSAFSLSGLGEAILQTSAKKYFSFYQETINTSLFYSLGITICGILGFSYYFYKDNLTLALGCLLISILQPIINSFQYVPVFLQGSGRYMESTLLQSIKAITITLFSLVILLMTKSVILLFFSFLFISAATSWVSYIWYKPTSETKVSQQIKNTYIRYARHTSLRNILGSISNRLDIILVFVHLGAVELAIYTIATVVPEQIKASFKNLASLLLPKYAKNNLDRIAKSVPKRSLQLFVLLFGITCVYLVIAPYLYSILFPKYENVAFYSQISALAFPAFVLLIPYTISQSQLAEKELYKITLYGSVFQVVSLIILIYFFGLLGAIVSKVLYRFFSLILSFVYLRKNFKDNSISLQPSK